MGASDTRQCSELISEGINVVSVNVPSLQFETLWREGDLLDVQLRTADGQSVAAHKLVLAAHSAFFRTLFSPCWEGGSKETVNVEGVSPQALYTLVEALYTGRLELSCDSVDALLAAASQLDFASVVDACCQFLAQTVSVANVCHVLQLADTYHQGALFHCALQFWIARAAEFVESPALARDVLALPFGIFALLLEQQLMNVSELDVLMLILGWVERDGDARLPRLPELLARLRADAELVRVCTLAAEACSRLALPTLSCSPSRACGLHHPAPASLPAANPGCPAQHDGAADQRESGPWQAAWNAQPPLCSTEMWDKGGCQRSDGPTHQDAACERSNACVGALQTLLAWPAAAERGLVNADDGQRRAALVATAVALLAGAGLLAPPPEATGDKLGSSPAVPQLDRFAGGAACSLGALSASASSDVARSWIVPSTAGSSPGEVRTPLIAPVGGRRTTHYSMEVDDWRAPRGGCESWGADARDATSQSGDGRRPTPRGILLAAGRDESWRGLTSAAIYDADRDRWNMGPELPNGAAFAQSAYVDGRAFLLGDGLCPLRWLDLERQTWRVAGAPGIGRALHACAAHGADFYVIGGRTAPTQAEASTLRYCSADDRWHSSHRLCTARTAAAAAACGVHLYVSGGQDNVRVFDCAECLDAERGWMQLEAHMQAPRKYHGMATVQRRLFCVGGKGVDGARLAGCEAFDPREGRWRSVRALEAGRSSCGVVSVGGRLYAMGGNDGDGTLLASVERYCPFMDRWEACAALPFACSGSAACPI